MKQAFLVSLGLHLTIALLLVVPLFQMSRRMTLPPDYQVSLVELPAPAAATPMAPPPEPLPARPPDKPPPMKPAKILTPVKPIAKPKPPAPPVVKPTPQPDTPAPAAIAPATAPTNVPVAVVPKIDAPEFDCSDYCAVFQRKLETQWIPPPLSGSEPVQAIVVFTINRDGSVSGVALEAGSGNFYFDQAAQRAVLLAAPLPPLPRSFQNPTLKVHVAFTWQAAR